MRDKKKYGCGILLLTLLLFCLGKSLTLRTWLSSHGEGTLWELEEEGIPLRNAVEIKKANADQEEPMTFTFWEQQDGRLLENPEFARMTPVHGIVLLGDSRLVFKGGGFLEEGDLEGCLMDEDTAAALFGNRNGVGQTVRYEGRELVVRGLLEGVTETIVMEAEKDGMGEDEENLSFHHISLFHGADQKQDVISRFQNLTGIEGTVLSLAEYGRISAAVGGLFLLWVAFSVLVPSFRLAQTGESFAKKTVYLAVSLGMIGLFCWMVEPDFSIPPEWIPSRWSDFDFWKALWEEQTQTFQNLFFGEPSQPVWFYRKPLLQCLGYTAGAAACFGVGRRFWQVETERELLIGSILSILLSFGVLLKTETAEGRILWLLPLFYLGGQFWNSRIGVKREEEKKSYEAFF